jgi:hypothetical protein
MERPDVDSIDGLSPAISIEQKTTSRSPRSTVGTITEIYDYLRLLYASIGVPHCPKCGRPIARQSAEQIVQRVMSLTPEDRVMVMAPIVRGRKGEFKKEMEKLVQHGFARARVDGELVNLEDELDLDKRKNHTIEVVIDRLLVKPGIEHRLEMSVGLAMKLAGGLVQVAVVGGEFVGSTDFANDLRAEAVRLLGRERRHLDGEPAAVARVVAPQRRHGGPGVARDHGADRLGVAGVTEESGAPGVSAVGDSARTSAAVIFLPARSNSSTTRSPTPAPKMERCASSAVFTGSPFTFAMMSPTRTPAVIAGLFGSTRETTSPPV